MYSAVKSRNGYQRDFRAKLCAFSVVVGIVGFLLLSKSYYWKSTFWDDPDPITELDTNTEPRMPTLDSSAHTSDIPEVFYGIIFDAGSTGSRVHAMKFQASGPGKSFKLLDMLFRYSKPGLSSFANDPAKGAANLKPLLDIAKAFIPEKKYKSVPLVLKATAGLRLLPKEQSDALLEEVRKLFKGYPFLVFDDSVGIMEGTDEGIFSWFTLNFFMGKLENVKDTIGVMDLGGGSTQVTFVPREATTLKEVAKDHLKNIDILGSKHDLYTHSYLGLGLMSARLQILGGQQGDGGKTLESVCMTPGVVKQWKHGGSEYTVKGLTNSENRFEACYGASKKLVSGKIEQVREIQDDHFCTISYYYDRAVDFGLIEEKHDGGNLTVQQYFEAAQKECTRPHPDTPFLCLDLSYISALLHDGFGFHKETKLLVIKRVHGHEISWALGAMFNYFNVHHIRSTKS